MNYGKLSWKVSLVKQSMKYTAWHDCGNYSGGCNFHEVMPPTLFSKVWSSLQPNGPMPGRWFKSPSPKLKQSELNM